MQKLESSALSERTPSRRLSKVLSRLFERINRYALKCHLGGPFVGFDNSTLAPNAVGPPTPTPSPPTRTPNRASNSRNHALSPVTWMPSAVRTKMPWDPIGS
jgi:hypothetical protein